VGGRTVVALQSDHLGARKVALESQDVVHLGAPPAVDRLVVIADAAEVADGLRQEAQPQVLRDVGVLVFVDQDVAEAAVVFAEHVLVAGEDRQVVEQEVAEVAGVQHPQALLVQAVERLAAIVGEVRALGRRQLVRGPATVLPVVDQAGEMARRPALCVDVLSFQELLDQPLLIVDVDDRVVGLQSDKLGVPAQDLGGDRVEGAKPAQALGLAADQVGDARAHLARRLVGEGDRQQLPGAGPAGGEDMGEARGQHAGLARAGPGQHQHRALGRLDRAPLLGVQSGQIVARRVHAREVADTGGRGVGQPSAASTLRA
jgi:hypothetical protein